MGIPMVMFNGSLRPHAPLGAGWSAPIASSRVGCRLTADIRCGFPRWVLVGWPAPVAGPRAECQLGGWQHAGSRAGCWLVGSAYKKENLAP